MHDDLLRAMEQHPVLMIRDSIYMPKPNWTYAVMADFLPPAHLTTTGFAVVFSDDGRQVILANELQRARLEIPGGHIDPGETPAEAAIREVFEETGAEVADLRPIGFLRQVVGAERPPGYQYPYPVSFQQFFVGRLVKLNRYEANDECGEPAILPIEDALEILNPRHAAFLRQAIYHKNLRPAHRDLEMV